MQAIFTKLRALTRPRHGQDASGVSGEVTSITRAMVAGGVVNGANHNEPVELEVFYGNGRRALVTSQRSQKAKDARPLEQRFSFKVPKEHLGESELDKVGVKLRGADAFLPGSPLADPNPDLSTLTTTYKAITEGADLEKGPPIDRNGVDESSLTANQRQWRDKGYIRLSGVIDGKVLEAYEKARSALESPTGWRSPAPYMHVPALKSLCCDAKLAALLEELVGEPMGVHLNLTGWVSTERNWHQDDYLSDHAVRGWRAGVWIALEDIDPRSGPFEYVPG
jgi:hypothetical protein